MSITHLGGSHMYGERLRELANYLSEGNTNAEAVEHFRRYSYSASIIKRSINENLPYENSKMYFKLKSKRYMILQRVQSTGCTFSEARVAFHVSWDKLDELMREFYEFSPRQNLKMYLRYRAERHSK